MSKWIIQHTKLLTWLFIAIDAVFAFLFAYFEILKPIYIFIIYMIAIIAFVAIVNTISIKYFKKIMAEFEQTCKPQQIIEYLNICYKNNPKNIVNQMNYVVALMLDKNNMQTARMLMETMQIDKIPEKSANLRYIYYNNLCLIYIDLNELDKAEDAYIKALDYNNKIKQPLFKLKNQAKLSSLACELATKKNNIEEALTYLPKLKKDTLLERVSYALHLGRIYIAQNEIEKAREQLSFVVEHASEICDGQEAKELLLNLS